MLMILGAAITSSALTAILVVLLLKRDDSGGNARYHITFDQPMAAWRRF